MQTRVELTSTRHTAHGSGSGLRVAGKPIISSAPDHGPDSPDYMAFHYLWKPVRPRRACSCHVRATLQIAAVWSRPTWRVLAKARTCTYSAEARVNLMLARLEYDIFSVYSVPVGRRLRRTAPATTADALRPAKSRLCQGREPPASPQSQSTPTWRLLCTISREPLSLATCWWL